MSGWGFGYPGHPSDEVLKAKAEAEATQDSQKDADDTSAEGAHEASDGTNA